MLQKSSMYDVMSVFFDKPNRVFCLMDISRQIKLAHTSVKKNLDELVNKKLIVVEKEKKGKRKYPIYKANKDDVSFKKYKKIYNLTKIVESGIVEYINDKLMPKTIVLFGSYQKGEDDENSDIDLFVECPKEEINLSAFEKQLDRKIQLQFNTKFSDYSVELKNNIINGIVLRGYLEGYK